MILQLNPLIELSTPKGNGYAMLIIDYGMDTDLYWVVSINNTGEIWTFPNHEVRAVKNITLGRITEKQEYKGIYNETFRN